MKGAVTRTSRATVQVSRDGTGGHAAPTRGAAGLRRCGRQRTSIRVGLGCSLAAFGRCTVNTPSFI
ncbi:MAG: hypothetical protein N2688_09610, partial [Burkholderiaceae bacterium]|nr:hypothetical protein [Burkholderiaceae bacterium]